jgi:ribosomal-protein-alanine N-acetyltransferase
MNKIRAAELSEVTKLWELDNALFTDPWSEDNIRSAVLQKNVFVYEVSGEIAGYMFIGGDKQEIDISVLAVDERYRRQGIAKSLIAFIIEKNPEAVLWLEVREQNNAARKLYENFGFTEIYRRENYYEKPKDNAIIMSRKPISKQ